MDTTLLRTFLEVTATGSFVAASERLFVTQSAVSLRVQKLEDELGRPLFTRSKAGAELTPAGREFERFALGHIKLWEEAKQQIAIPDGFTKSLVIGAQYSLWPRLGFRWTDAIRRTMPDLSLRAEVGMPDRLTRFLIEGVIQSALMYTPQLRPGLKVDKIMDEELVMVASWANPNLSNIADRYVFVDWGPEFVQAHSIHLGDLTNPGMTLALGTMVVDYMLNRAVAAYVPARAVSEHLAKGTLHLVPDAPRFPYPVYHIWREDLSENIIRVARKTLSQTIHHAESRQDKVIDALASISDEDRVLILGETPMDE